MGRREKLEGELKKIIEKLRSDKSIRLILLFGSLAKGDVGSESDIDLIVVKETNKKFLDRLDEFYEDANMAMDVLVYTPEEFRSLKNRRFIMNAVKEGKVLYEA
jgi:predicted nucleotidyltransferase